MSENSDAALAANQERLLNENKNRKLYITPKEARKILGKEASAGLDDNGLRAIIITLEDIARMLVLNPIRETKEKTNGTRQQKQ